MDDYSPTHSIGEHSHAQGQEAVGEQVSEKLIYEGHWNYPDFAYKHDVNIYASTVYKPDDVSNSMKIENAVEYGQCDCTAQPTSIDVPATKTPDKDGAEVIEEVFCNANQSKGESEAPIAHAAAMLPSKEAATESYEVKKNEEACFVEKQSHYSHAEAKEIVEKPVEDVKEEVTHGDEFTANLEELPSTTIECDVIASQEGSTGKGVSKSFSEKSIEHASISADLKVNQTPSDLPNLTARSKEEYVTTEEKTLQPQNDTAAAPSDSLTIPEKPPHSNVAESATMASEIVAIRTTVASAPPTPPPRRNSILPDGLPPATPTPTMRSFHRQPSISSSRTNTMNYNYALGRLSFPTLPRNARPPRKEDVIRKRKPKSMFSWLGGDSSKKKNKEVLDSVSEGLRKIYKQKLYPLEEHYKFHEFHSPALDDPDFDAKPMILLVGQYSTGKTTFIRYLLEEDFPGIRIGPEPTTDRFIAVMHGDEEGVIPGNALVVDAKKQFRALSGFGNAFLNRFQCSTLNNQVLESVTIVDTPGILSGEKQRIDRGYDFTGVLEWFAERVDRIILLFDAHKLDISDEFKRCIEALSGNEDKIRIVLNKSDMVDHQQLMRVYGALMWSLGKVFKTPEVSRVYIGTFWDHPLHYDINRRLFQDEQHDLFQDLQALPRNAALRKLNDLIKRARLAKVHAYIISELRKQMPSMIGKEKKKKELIQNLDKIFEQVQREHNISPGDFPDVNKMRDRLQTQDFTRFNPIKPKLLEIVDGMLASDIARLMAQIPKEEAQVTAAATTNGHVAEQPTVKGGAFSQAQEAETPFGFGRGEGFDKGADEPEWVVSRERNQADATFESLGPVDGYISGRVAKEHMVKSKLPNSVLGKIWKLADVDRDGQLDADEFALANYLINLKLEGHELPVELPKHLVPPSKREMEPVYPKLDDE
nr:Dynamin and EF hand domain containing protein [Haemonchus contortus]